MNSYLCSDCGNQMRESSSCDFCSSDNIIEMGKKLEKKPKKLKDLRMKKTNPDAVLLEYATSGSVGLDLRSIDEYNISTGKQVLVKTGLVVEIPDGFIGMVCPRSGLALKDGLTILNAPGSIDRDYCGDNDEVGVILFNTGSVHEEYHVKKGDRVAQLVLVPCPQFNIIEVDSLREENRGGFGSTGKE